MLIALHTRMLSLRLTWGEGGGVVVDGRIFDLRKRGIVPMAGKLQGPGVVHDMAVGLQLDYPELRIRRIEPTMCAFPFAPGPKTLGEGCADRLPEAQRLVGVSLREAYGSTLLNTIGGPRGCFHVFTLMRMLGPTIEWAVDCERARRPDDTAPRLPGGPIFARSMIMDGFKGEGLRLVVRGMLCDLHYPPGADALPLEEEMEHSFEATAEVETEIPSLAVIASAARMRRSGPGIETVGAWEGVQRAKNLVGCMMLKGYTAQVQEVFAGTVGLDPLQHLIFMLAPTLMQCMPSLVEELEMRPRRAESPHAAVDSCHMWRAEGPLIAGSPWKEKT